MEIRASHPHPSAQWCCTAAARHLPLRPSLDETVHLVCISSCTLNHRNDHRAKCWCRIGSMKCRPASCASTNFHQRHNTRVWVNRPQRLHHVSVRASSSSPQQQQEAPQQAIAAPATLVVGDVEQGEVYDSPGSLVVVGDVKRGATLRADGDILVWGRLEGRVHAGRTPSPQAVSPRVMALELRGAQLKIGEVDTLAAAKVTVPGPHAARVEVVGARRRLALEPTNPAAINPDAAVLAASKVRWLRWYPAAGAALFTGLYAVLAGCLLLVAPEACFALLFPGTTVPGGWIRVGALLLVTFGAQYLGAAAKDWATAAASRPRPAPAPAAPPPTPASTTTGSAGGTAEAAAAAGGGGFSWGAGDIPPDVIMEAYSSGSYDEGDNLLWAATRPSTPQQPGQGPQQQQQQWGVGPSTSSSGYVTVVKTTSARTLSRGLDVTARRQAATAAAAAAGAGGGEGAGRPQEGTSSSSEAGSSTPHSSSSSSSSSSQQDPMAGGYSPSSSSSSSSSGQPWRPAATWLYSSNGFYWASIWSRLLLAAGFTWLVASGQVGPGLLLLAGLNAAGALGMAAALRRQWRHHVMGDAPRQSLLGLLLEGAL